MANRSHSTVFQAEDGLWYFKVKSATGLVLAVSPDGFSTRRDALSAVTVLRDALNEVPHKGLPTLMARMKPAYLDALAFDPGCA